MSLREIFHGWHNIAIIPRTLRWLYASVLVRQLGNSLLLVVTPAFFFFQAEQIPVLNSIFAETWKTQILAVVSFVALERILHLSFAPVFAHIIRRLGLRDALFFGQLARCLSLLLLSLFPIWPPSYFLAALTGAFVLGLYWTSYHVWLAQGMDPKLVGREIGSLELLLKLGTLIAPLVGVLLVPLMGFPGVFISGLGLHLLAALLIYRLPNLRLKALWRWKDFWKMTREPKVRKQFFGLAGWYWEQVGVADLWPLFLLISLQNITSVGYIFTAATLVSLLFAYLTGYQIDHHKWQRVLPLTSGALISLLWLPRILTPQFPLVAVVTDTFDRLASGVYQTIFSTKLILHSLQSHPYLYLFNREIVFDFTHILGFLAVLILLAVGWSWTLVFLSFLVGGLVSLQFVRKN